MATRNYSKYPRYIWIYRCLVFESAANSNLILGLNFLVGFGSAFKLDVSFLPKLPISQTYQWPCSHPLGLIGGQSLPTEQGLDPMCPWGSSGLNGPPSFQVGPVYLNALNAQCAQYPIQQHCKRLQYTNRAIFLHNVQHPIQSSMQNSFFKHH